MVILALRGTYGYTINPLSDQEILQNCGLAPAVLGPTFLDVSRYVHNVP